jgi:hypothetical protein
VLKEGENAERDDKPLPYQNTQSEWADSSFLSPYMRKYPGLYKGVKFVYDGMFVSWNSGRGLIKFCSRRNGCIYEARRCCQNREESLHGML